MANNEVRLIDANALIRVCEWAKTKNKHSEECATALDLCIELFKQAPPVHTVEVVRGRWIKKVDMVESYLTDCTEVFYECSVCEAGNIGETHYCPNCGAKMDEREEVTDGK